MSCPVFPRTHTLHRKTGKPILAEPFDDAAFVSRLQKLLPLLGSEQPGEAEAARRKLVEHLAHHRLSLSDVAARLRQGAALAPGSPSSFFGQNGRDAALERQLANARSARLQAESELRRSQAQVMELQQALQQAASTVGDTLRAGGITRLLAVLGWATACAAILFAVFMNGHVPVANLLHPMTTRHERGAPPLPPPPEDGTEAIKHLNPGEHFGMVLVQDLPIRLNPSDDAGVRAFLNRGMHVVIEQQAHVGTQTWLLIRSVTGTGWVRSGDVLH